MNNSEYHELMTNSNESTSEKLRLFLQKLNVCFNSKNCETQHIDKLLTEFEKKLDDYYEYSK